MDAKRAPFAQGEYGPELVRLMTEALESAWRQVLPLVKDVELGRLVLAGAIIEQVDLGMRAHDDLVASARKALEAALRLSGGEAAPLCLTQQSEDARASASRSAAVFDSRSGP
jgi:hypothetical protein